MNTSPHTTSLLKGFCLLVEDQIPTCEFLTKVLNLTFPELEIVIKNNVKEALTWINEYTQTKNPPSLPLALIDLGLPDGSGVELIRHLKKHEPKTMNIVVTIYDDDHYLFSALAAGASGYLLKEHDKDLLANILKRIEHGEPPLSPSIAHRVLSHFHTASDTSNDLTARETETLTLIAKGLTVAEAAAQMKLSPQTVAGYVKIIYQKLHISSRAEATHEAIRRGLV